MTRGSKVRASVAAAVFAFAVAITGCASEEPDYDPQAADALQSEVLEVSELSAADDFEAALLALTELEVDVKDALARGLITQERHDAILAAIALVVADLNAAIAAQQPPPPAPEADEGGGDGGGNGNEGDDDGDDDDKGNDDKGKDTKGKGNQKKAD